MFKPPLKLIYILCLYWILVTSIYLDFKFYMKPLKVMKNSQSIHTFTYNKQTTIENIKFSKRNPKQHSLPNPFKIFFSYFFFSKI